MILGTNYVLDLSNLGLGWTQKVSMTNPAFNFGVGTNREESIIFTFGGQGYNGALSDMIGKYSTELDQWSTIGTRLPFGSRTATSRGLDGRVWLFMTYPNLLVDLFDSGTETLAGLNITSIPSCKSPKEWIFLSY